MLFRYKQGFQSLETLDKRKTRVGVGIRIASIWTEG